MNEEIKIIIKAVTDSAKKEIGKVNGELGKMGKTASGSGGKIAMAMKGAGIAVAAVIGVVTALTGALIALGKNTLQFNREQAKLTTAFEATGASAAQAGETYKSLFRYLGDSGKAVEAASHLAKITNNEKDLAQWSKITQGIYASFGDSLPIEGLTEAANETLRVGKVTGNLADALNWAGASEDELNAKLAATNSYTEREAILRSTLNGLYEDAANIYERNNADLLAYNEAQANYQMITAEAGKATLPLLTAVSNLGATLMTALKPAIEAIVPILASFVNMISSAVQSITSFFAVLTGKNTTVKSLAENAAKAGKSVSTGLGSGLNNVATGADEAKSAIEAVKRSTQGFDE